ncbi:MAG TPA: glycogen/starch/alpha-glucan family phosphorylase [Rhabdochlamydiaceae bacterium]|nr:glycogen/starch/alpha-glucan family phosphorylase [Rhabdochlamydiaceae bacterium]
MTDDRLEAQADLLIQKLKHYLITSTGVTLDEATDNEFYRAFSLTLREEIMINWTATIHTIRKNRPRTIYYLCMEYMPGRLVECSVTNMHANHLVKIIMKKLGRDPQKVFSIEVDPGLGNGGLGRLASCLMDSLATQQYPAISYGLRYQYGIFNQEIWNGQQMERPEDWLLTENPWVFRRDRHSVTVSFSGKASARKNTNGEEVYDLLDPEKVRAMAYDIPIIGYKENADCNVLSLRLWTTKESPRNFQLQRYNAGLLDQAAENTSLTDVLYPNDNNELGKRVRLKQEFLLASASIQDVFREFLKLGVDFTAFADKVRVHINDTHPAIVIAELMHILLKDHNFKWGEAWDVVRTVCNYTNHTVLRESLEEWNCIRLQNLLPAQYRIIERLNQDFCNDIRKRFPNDEEKVRRMSIIENGQTRMAHLAIYGSHRVNGVSALHTEILKKDVFKDFNDMYPDRIVNVTNGVTQRKWILSSNPRLSEFLNKRIGKGWITDLKQLAGLSKFAQDSASQDEFLAVKKENKIDFFHFLEIHNPIRDRQGKIIGYTKALDGNALFDVQIKRFHEYKRQLLNVLHVIMLYHELQASPNARKIARMVIIGGKAAPGYFLMKNLIRCICCMARKINEDASVNSKLRLVFLENYNASNAERIIPAADLSEQISCAGLEASGTGNMKLTMNGALTIGTEDGANVEIHAQETDRWWPFKFGQTADQNRKMHKERSYTPWNIYQNNPAIKRAVDALHDRTFAETSEEHDAFSSLYSALLDKRGGEMADPYFVLNDLPSFYETQKRVEDLYVQPKLWAEYAIQNIAHMGIFSSDESIHNYANLVWNIAPCPVDKEELEKVKAQYNEYDKCRILTV